MNKKNNASAMPLLSKQFGFSIIELMISMAIGLVIVLFVSSLYLSSRGSSQLNDDSARLQQDGRIVMALIGRNLTQAGYDLPTNSTYENNALIFSGQAFAACDHGFTTTNLNEVFVGATSCTGTVEAPAFQVSYLVDNQVNVNIGAGTDCNGQTVPQDGRLNRVVVNRFYLATAADDTVPSLYCVGNGNAVGQPLLSNVEAMSVRYGVHAGDINGDHTPDGFYGSAASVLAAEALAVPVIKKPFGGVVSVEVCLQLISPNNVATAPQTYLDCSGATKTATDKKLHIALKSVFTIRNNAGSTLLTYPNHP